MAELASLVSGMVAGSMCSPCASHSAAMASARAASAARTRFLAGVRTGLPSSRTETRPPRQAATLTRPCRSASATAAQRSPHAGPLGPPGLARHAAPPAPRAAHRWQQATHRLVGNHRVRAGPLAAAQARDSPRRRRPRPRRRRAPSRCRRWCRRSSPSRPARRRFAPWRSGSWTGAAWRVLVRRLDGEEMTLPAFARQQARHAALRLAGGDAEQDMSPRRPAPPRPRRCRDTAGRALAAARACPENPRGSARQLGLDAQGMLRRQHRERLRQRQADDAQDVRAARHRQRQRVKACSIAAQIACWLSTSVPSQSKMTSFMGGL